MVEEKKKNPVGKLDDMPYLVELHRHFTNQRISQANTGWETIKLNTVLSSALISLAVYSIIYVYTSEFFWKPEVLTFQDRFVVRILLLLIPIILGFINWRLHRNFNRQCIRIYELASIVIKIEEKMGLHQERTEKENFPNDKWYVPDDWKDSCCCTSKKFVDDCMKKKDAFYKSMVWVFRIFGFF